MKDGKESINGLSADDNNKASTGNAHNTGRRSFVTKAAVIAPIAMVSLSKPAWADKTGIPMRCGISGLVSGDTSRNPDREYCQGGFSPGYWGNKNGWPIWASSPGHDTMFCDIFTSCVGVYDGKDYTNAQLGDVIPFVKNKSEPTSNGKPNGYYEGSFGFHALAAYLNSLYVPNYVFSTAEVLDLANTAMTTGSVEIMGVIYSGEDLKALFNSTY